MSPVKAIFSFGKKKHICPSVCPGICNIFTFELPKVHSSLSLSVISIPGILCLSSKKPTILAFQQKFPPDLANKVGLAGGVMTTTIQSVGCVGAISNGPSRDIDEIRPMKFQYLLSGITPGHGEMAIRAINVPVHIAGMDVAPGEIIHMDENGACKFPADHLEAVVTNVRALQKEEETTMKKIRSAKTAEDIKQAFIKKPYGRKK